MFEQVRQGRGVRGWARWSSLAFLALGCSAGPEGGPEEGSPTGLEARSGFEKVAAPERPAAVKSRLIAKFKDSLRVRAEPDGGVRSAASAADTRMAAELGPLARQYGMRFSQHIQLPEASLQDLESEAAQASGRAQPDLAGVLAVEVPEESVEETAEALQASPLTEYVYFEQVDPPPPQQACSDLSPETPNFTPQQTYHGPVGLNLTAAMALAPSRGAGVWFADCEYSYNRSHEDLCGIIPGLPPISYEDDFAHHGTAALGELVSSNNPYGCTGISPEATAYFFSEQNGRRVTAITQAVRAMRAGDVLLLEMQTSGSKTEVRYVPAEFELAVWDAVKVGTDKGVIVVAAAGNGFENGLGGGENLDSANYADYRARGDSGAIIVGAGASNARHDKLSYSTFGSRVNVQGWGENIVTTGYGDLARVGEDVNQAYTNQFGGTSGASAMVAGAVVWLQGVANTYLHRRLKPLEMRKLLTTTGTPQGSGGHIGPIPNLEAAAKAIMAGNPCGDGSCAR